MMLDRICGTVTVRFTRAERRILTALLLRENIRAVSIKNTDDGGLLTELCMRDWRRLCARMEERGCIPPAVLSVHGLPRLLAYLRRRPGMAIGASLMLAVMIVSTMFCWRVDVICLDNAQGTDVRDGVDVYAVRGALAGMGVGEGMFLWGLDARGIENRYLLAHADVSWMAVNRRGTVLSVEVRPSHAVPHDRETPLIPDGEGFLVGTHLVADADGIVRSSFVRGGVLTVQPEQIVLRGQLLASGVYTSDTGDIVCGRAQGEVLADTVRILTARVPLTETVQCATGEVRTEYELALFGHGLLKLEKPLPWVRQIVTFLQTFRNWLKKTGIDGASCGIIADEAISDARESHLCLPDGLPLPVSVRVTTYSGVTKATRELDAAQARLRAKADLDAQEAALGVHEIYSREESEEWDDGVLTVIRYVSCRDNIAATEEYRIREQHNQTEN